MFKFHAIPPPEFDARPDRRDFRQGDVRHSHADVSKAARLLGYQPMHRFRERLKEVLRLHVGAKY
jgi:UDP-N-acetylglucosamine/UDP-N-acetylgalactosamine 4-epimerase